MVTIAETPHDARITCLRLRPRRESSVFDEMAVTADKGGKIKFWVLQANENEGTVTALLLKCQPRSVSQRPKCNCISIVLF